MNPPDGPDNPGADDPLAEPFALRDVSERLPNESLRSELETMSDEEREAYLRHLEELSKQYLGPGGP
ncbi:MAG: hypothetical protein IT335_15110 [Thermomicrobiales bacterium]|nr:hypothetical protein [Thermomicrobiales bacterium]